jgi:hypothetical protein
VDYRREDHAPRRGARTTELQAIVASTDISRAPLRGAARLLPDSTGSFLIRGYHRRLLRSQVRVLPSRRDSWPATPDPALKCWAVPVRPYGTGRRVAEDGQPAGRGVRSTHDPITWDSHSRPEQHCGMPHIKAIGECNRCHPASDCFIASSRHGRHTGVGAQRGSNLPQHSASHSSREATMGVGKPAAPNGRSDRGRPAWLQRWLPSRDAKMSEWWHLYARVGRRSSPVFNCRAHIQMAPTLIGCPACLRLPTLPPSPAHPPFPPRAGRGRRPSRRAWR